MSPRQNPDDIHSAAYSQYRPEDIAQQTTGHTEPVVLTALQVFDTSPTALDGSYAQDVVDQVMEPVLADPAVASTERVEQFRSGGDDSIPETLPQKPADEREWRELYIRMSKVIADHENSQAPRAGDIPEK